jgi:hypothetical protein
MLASPETPKMGFPAARQREMRSVFEKIFWLTKAAKTPTITSLKP